MGCGGVLEVLEDIEDIESGAYPFFSPRARGTSVASVTSDHPQGCVMMCICETPIGGEHAASGAKQRATVKYIYFWQAVNRGWALFGSDATSIFKISGV